MSLRQEKGKIDNRFQFARLSSEAFERKDRRRREKHRSTTIEQFFFVVLRASIKIANQLSLFLRHKMTLRTFRLLIATAFIAEHLF